MGSSAAEINPISTMTIEMTQARIGRSMKNRASIVSVSGALASFADAAGNFAGSSDNSTDSGSVEEKGISASFGSTTTPGRTRCNPFTITRSFGCTPLSITRMPACRAPTRSPRSCHRTAWRNCPRHCRRAPCPPEAAARPGRYRCARHRHRGRGSCPRNACHARPDRRLPLPVKSCSTIWTSVKAACALSIPVSSTATVTPAPDRPIAAPPPRRFPTCRERRLRLPPFRVRSA